MKFSKENFGWIFATFALALALGFSIYMGLTGWYFKHQLSYTTDMELGKSVIVDIDKNSANALSMDFEGSYLSGERLPQMISVKNVSDGANIYLRAKIYVYSADNVLLDMDMIETSNWQRNEDGYFYYIDLLPSNAKATLCSHVIVGENSVYNTNTRYIFTIVFESLEESLSPTTIWGVNPLQNV